jgi:hypothetical protein
MRGFPFLFIFKSKGAGRQPPCSRLRASSDSPRRPAKPMDRLRAERFEHHVSKPSANRPLPLMPVLLAAGAPVFVLLPLVRSYGLH